MTHRWLALLLMTLLLGGCGMSGSGSGSGAGSSSEKPTNEMTDQQSMAQVVDPAIQIVRAVQLEDVTGGFSYGSCNDQGDPPFQGRVEVAFKMPTTGNPNDVF